MTDSRRTSEVPKAPTDAQLDRRTFLKASGGAGLGLILGGSIGGSILAACSSSGGSPSAAAASAAASAAAPTAAGGPPIKLGGLFHKTGVGAIWGDLQERPTILAVEEINKAGGVLGRQLTLISEDDQTNPDVTVRMGTKLAQEDGVEAIFGLVYSSTRSAVAANVADRYKVPYFYPTYSEGGVCGRYFVNLGALPNQQLDFFIPYLMDRFGKNFYFVGQDYVWPRESIAYCAKLITDAGGTVSGTEFVPFGTTDWGPILGRIKAKAPNVYFPFIGGDDLISNLRQFFDFGLNKTVGLASTLLDESFIPTLPEGVRGGIPCSASYFMAIDTPENKDFLARYQTRWGADAIATNITEGTYDSVYMWKAAIEKAGKVDKEAMIDALQTVSFKAPQGEISMLAGTNHARLHQIIADTQPDGTFKLIKDFGLTDPVSNCKI